jgi:hypothetical protein
MNDFINNAALVSRLGLLGQKAMAQSTPVVISSDQTPLSVNISTVPLATNAATETTLSAINTKLTEGQDTMANSIPVVIASNQTTLPVTFAPPTIGDFGYDAGGRQRVSQLTTLLDGKILGEDDVTLFENVGTGTATYGSNKVNLSVTAGQYEIRQTRRFYPYFSGKAQLVECTFDNFQTQANVTKRVGYFSSNAVAPYASNFDGFFFEDNGTIKSLKAYRNGTLTVDVPFTTMDNYALVSSYDWSQFTVIAFDFLWLGGAILRLWLKTDLGFVLLHTVNYSGTSTDTFTISPNQTLRYEIRSTTGVGSLRYICSQIASEGSINESGKSLAIFNFVSATTNTIGTIYALKGIKKQTAFRDTAVQVQEMSVANTGSTSDTGILLLLLNPTLTGGPLTYVNRNKIQDGSPTLPATPPTITSVNLGRVLAAIPAGAGVTGITNAMQNNFLGFLGQTIDNTMDEYVVAYMPTTSNQSVNAVLTIKEL